MLEWHASLLWVKKICGLVSVKITPNQGGNSYNANVTYSSASFKWNQSFSNAVKNQEFGCNPHNRIVMVSLVNGIGNQGKSRFLTFLSMTKHLSRTAFFRISRKCEFDAIAIAFPVNNLKKM